MASRRDAVRVHQELGKLAPSVADVRSPLERVMHDVFEQERPEALMLCVQINSTKRHEELVRAFGAGDLIAASTLQPEMEWFDTSFGAVAYRRAFGIDMTLGAPLCSPSDRPELAHRFVARSRRPVFCYVRQDFVPEVHDSPLFCAGMGFDRHVDLDALLDTPSREVTSATASSVRSRSARSAARASTDDPKTLSARRQERSHRRDGASPHRRSSLPRLLKLRAAERSLDRPPCSKSKRFP